jgi:phage baseplate assembly protein W
VSQERKVYDFASVGEFEEDIRNRTLDTRVDTPIGILTPVSFSNTNASLFEMHSDLGKQIKDNFRNMISTNHGERIMLNDFGANLADLAFELGVESVDAEAMKRIMKTASKYMPFVELTTFESVTEKSLDGTLARIGVIVTFSVPSLGISAQSIKAIINVVG